MSLEELAAALIKALRRPEEKSSILHSKRLAAETVWTEPAIRELTAYNVDEDTGSQLIGAGGDFSLDVNRMYWIYMSDADFSLLFRRGGAWETVMQGSATSGTPPIFIYQKYSGTNNGAWMIRNTGGAAKRIWFSWREFR